MRTTPNHPYHNVVANILQRASWCTFQLCGPRGLHSNYSALPSWGEAAGGHGDTQVRLRHDKTLLTGTETCNNRLIFSNI